MRIPCPICGERDVSEFTYLGDARPRRPEGMKTSAEDMFAYVYLRDNPSGNFREYWYHAAGCHAWLIVTRNVTTHEILAAGIARDVLLRERGAPGALGSAEGAAL
jgi:sarcosine oxidase subunit delta